MQQTAVTKGARPYLLALGGFLLLWLSLLGFSGALTSGYHFMDDHEILRINADLRSPGGSFTRVAHRWVSEDLHRRLRPMYYLSRVAEVRLFGGNLVALAVYRGLLAAATGFLLLCFMRLAGFSWPASLMLPAMGLLGHQAEAWWALGPAESPGMALLAGALAALAAGLRSEGWRARALTGLLVVLAAGASLCKESFVAALPALAFACVWLARQRDRSATWRRALGAQAVPAALLLAVFAVEVAIIVFFVGTSRIGYAGVGGDLFSPAAGGKALRVLRVFSTYGGGLPAAAAALVLLGCYAERRGALRPALQELGSHCGGVCTFAVLLVLPQVLLYTKSGIWGRYYLPAALGCALFLAWLWDFASSHRRGMRPVLLALVLMQLGLGLAMTVKGARGYAVAGRAIGSFLREVEREAASGEPVLIAADPARQGEMSLSLKTWFAPRGLFGNFYVLSLPASNYAPWEQKFVKKGTRFFGSRTLEAVNDRSRIRCVAVLPATEARFLKAAQGWFDPEGWQRSAFRVGRGSAFVVYRRK